MEKFSTARRLACGSALLAGLCAQAPALPVSSGEHSVSPQPRALPPAVPSAPADVAAWPRVIVLEAQPVSWAEVAGAHGGAQLFVAGQVLRVRQAGALRGARFTLYRPGPRLYSGAGRDALGRLAFRVARVELLHGDRERGEAQVRVTRGEREIMPGDLVLDELPSASPVPGVAPPREIAARVAAQRDGERMRFAAAGQVVALDRGALDGVRAHMCLRLPGREPTAGRVLHAGAHAAAAQLLRAHAPLEPGDAVLLAPCAD